APSPGRTAASATSSRTTATFSSSRSSGARRRSGSRGAPRCRDRFIAHVTKAKRWFVYLLECKDGTLYTGIAKDVKARIALHDAGKGAKYTRGRGPVRLLAKSTGLDLSGALKLEIRIKRLPKEEKLSLLRPERRRSRRS